MSRKRTKGSRLVKTSLEPNIIFPFPQDKFLRTSELFRKNLQQPVQMVYIHKPPFYNHPVNMSLEQTFPAFQIFQLISGNHTPFGYCFSFPAQFVLDISDNIFIAAQTTKPKGPPQKIFQDIGFSIFSDESFLTITGATSTPVFVDVHKT